MLTPASIRRHPIHPMLVSIPIGLWLFALVCDLISVVAVHRDIWFVVSLNAMIGGTLGAFVAAIPGAIDLLSLRKSRHRRVALAHMSLNLVIVVLYLVNLFLRIRAPADMGAPLTLSVISILMLGVSGWLGGSLVHVHGVGVDPAALEEDRDTR